MFYCVYFLQLPQTFNFYTTHITKQLAMYNVFRATDLDNLSLFCKEWRSTHKPHVIHTLHCLARYIYLAYVFATTANIYGGCSPRCLVTAGPSLDVKGTACFPPAVLPLSRPAAPSPRQISLHCPLHIVSSFIFLMGLFLMGQERIFF